MLRNCWAKAAVMAAAFASLAALAACGQFMPSYMKPLSAQTRALLAEKGMRGDSPILIRIFKAESVLEIWKQKDDGRFYFFKSYPICNYSGTLGPKIDQGDRQAPEGFYMVSESQMNPRSKYHLAFNVGFPNAYDRSYGRTGDDIMVHGDCRSAGCYAMTDGVIQEIYILAQDALNGGQQAFQIQAFPFRMTAANMAAHRNSKWYPFWENLKQGYDYFNETRLPPTVDVCNHTYLFDVAFVNPNVRPDPSGPCPAYRRLPETPYTAVPHLQQTMQGPDGWKIKTLPGNQTASLSPDVGPPPKPLGAQLGLSFGPSKPQNQMFALGSATPKSTTH
jgi:murein L,D-transpeptidase YafK